ncbi:MAG: hypothetical protein CFE26_08540 [Verrucomicrobiales bacterium VVV1]|nr:MAG: hypothetical protein CFE26_08540 [Verrucomicrobiales bacterium VVV1]
MMKFIIFLALTVHVCAADLPANVELAARQLDGEVAKMDQAFILESFRRGSEAGIARAHAGLADCHSWGVGMPRNEEPVRRLREMAAKAGDAVGMLRLGEDLISGRGGPRDPQRGIELIRKASALGLKNADASLAIRSLIGEGLPVDRDTGLKRLHELADTDGNSIAAFFLGQFYRGEFGNQDGKNPELARKYLMLAAEKNHAKAMVILGDMTTEKGGANGKPEPRMTAADWYRKAVDRNSGEAMFKLGRMQQRDKQARREGEDWFQLLLAAARVGFGEATQYLGELHYHATGYTYRDLDWSKTAHFHEKYLSDGFGGGNSHISLHRLFEVYFEGGLGLNRDFRKCLEIAQPHLDYCSSACLYAGRVLLHPDSPMGTTREHYIRGYACLLKSATLEASTVDEEVLFVLRSRHGMSREEVARAEALVRGGFPNSEPPLLP